MARHFKGIGGWCAVVMASLAVLAPIVQAAPKYTPSQYPATMKGSQVAGERIKLAIGANLTIECGQMSFEGSVASKAEAEGSSFGVNLFYLECVGELLGSKLPFTLNLNGCNLGFSLQEEASGSIKAEGWQYTGGLTIKCPEGQKVDVIVYQTQKKHEEGAPICAYTIAGQGPVGSVDYKLDEAGTVLTVKPTVAGIAVTKTTGTLVSCGKAEQTMSIAGNIAFEAFNGEGAMLTGSFDAS